MNQNQNNSPFFEYLLSSARLKKIILHVIYLFRYNETTTGFGRKWPKLLVYRQRDHGGRN